MTSALEYNAMTGEPFLRLPAPFQNIIITPPRMSDIAPSTVIMSNRAVSRWMGPNGPGSTYTEVQAEGWIRKIKPEADAILDEVRRTPGGPVSGCPVRHIREERADGTDIFIGDIAIGRASFVEVQDKEERARLLTENNARVLEIPRSYYLAPSHHGRGLTTVAVKTIIHQWGIPAMKIKLIRTGTFEGNHGSMKVLQKNGFVVVETLANLVQLEEGGEKTTLYILELVV
ncbi:hypothetical protein C8F04DRAFT_1094715 [Mycena alexandri]|uniref:N-acetyltransferase domain-containing protein n=1 Tax=Mycena alexandri TaxID=1745969 RepID=A0AAD6SYN6_9AGAR|nr:hypothetical protein C8F04DRAFT_1094715 [Mycena alexandri]